MPVWHKAAKKWIADGKLIILGLTQEQHPHRCRLFAQWKKFDWPILHDPINVIRSIAVPILVAIDEHGIVRNVNPDIETFEKDFINKKFSRPSSRKTETIISHGNLTVFKKKAIADSSLESWRSYGDQLAVWGKPEAINQAIDAYREALKIAPKDGDVHFRLGVCYRMRYESDLRRPGDFQEAVNQWNQALSLAPNQYIWRRRIQQYGPRLDKPYSFYDWVRQARAEIIARGEKPIELHVEPSGAEIAYPSRTFARADSEAKEPDQTGRIRRDVERLIQAEVTVVPARIKPGQTARVHVTLRPNLKRHAYWNNEVEPTKMWVKATDQWQIQKHLLTAPLGAKAETQELRRLEFEVKAPENARGPAQLFAYALYYVCEGVRGTCLYLRKDIQIKLNVVK